MRRQSETDIKVIVNADDFGYGERVNDTIREAMAKKCITSTTIMANGPAVNEAMKMMRDYPAISFGIHLNLTEFLPLLPSPDLQSAGLVDGDGQFLGNGFRRLRPSPRLMEACYQELDQQLRSLHEKGLKPSHFDSHHHIHTIPWLMPVICKLQRKYQIFRIRNTLNVYRSTPGEFPRKRLLAAKKLWEVAATLLGSRMPERFASLQSFLADPFQPEYVSAWSIELMCHPGQGGFEAETEQLLSKGQSILPPGYCLANYTETLA